jgi:hypothetical protein
MTDFKPSADFTFRTMEEIRSYESELENQKNRVETFLHSRLGILVLSAGGALFGITHFIRFASTLIFPALCR